ncbi:MAG: exodeoxyribonuclease V subunit alpha [SAR324 cluster bacterium]|nr:exodeoxyribonuclease V subunit alpha [SAR324 cluster bacterium]
MKSPWTQNAETSQHSLEKWSDSGSARLRFQQLYADLEFPVDLRLEDSPWITALQEIFLRKRVESVHFFQVCQLIRSIVQEFETPSAMALLTMTLLCRLEIMKGSTCILTEDLLEKACDILSQIKPGDVEYNPEFLLQILSPQYTSLVGMFEDFAPLILSEDQRLVYLHQYYIHESHFQRLLKKRLDMELQIPDVARIKLALQAVFVEHPVMIGNHPLKLSPQQLCGVLLVLQSPITIISGGPGTGKTSVILSLLRVLHQLGMAQRIGLGAPTGRAAKRMAESLRSGLQNISSMSEQDHALLDLIPQSRTLHRLLGYRPHSGTYTFHEYNPLEYDVVIVDESSMIDLFLMTHLMKALHSNLPYQAHVPRLVLIGDSQQLPSVGAGAVLKDLIPETLSMPELCQRFIKNIAPELTEFLSDNVSSVPHSMSGRAMRLTESYRQKSSDPGGRHILEISRRIHPLKTMEDALSLIEDTHPETGLHLIKNMDHEDPVPPGISYLEQANTPEKLHLFIRNWFDRFFQGSFLQQTIQTVYNLDELQQHALEFETLFEFFQTFKILAFTRIAPTGVEFLNQSMKRYFFQFFQLGSPDPLAYFAGAPVMVMENDYANSLFNGDQGIFLKFHNPESGQTELKALFQIEGKFHTFYDYQLKQIQLSYAITVHKSQGSEYNHVAIVLPVMDTDGALQVEDLLSKELIYTAITRAKQSVLILGSRSVLGKTLTQTTIRYSGLSQALALSVIP